jgi:hypothetical protein
MKKINEIIEDTISRNKAFQEERLLRLNRLKALNAPDILIEREEMISKMTIAEYNSYLQQEIEQEMEEYKKIKSEYAKNNRIQQSIVDEIYNRESKLEYDYFTYSDEVHLMRAIDPLSFMSEEDYMNDLYETFLNHAIEIYRDRFKNISELKNEEY